MISKWKPSVDQGTQLTVKWHSVEKEKMIANIKSDKGLISKMYKEPLQVNNNKTQLKIGPRTWIDISPKKVSDQISRSVVSDSLWPHESRSMPGLPVHHQLPEFTQTHVHRVSDAIQPSQPLSSPSPLAPNPSQHQSLFQWVNSSHEVAKVLDFQL